MNRPTLRRAPLALLLALSIQPVVAQVAPAEPPDFSLCPPRDFLPGWVADLPVDVERADAPLDLDGASITRDGELDYRVEGGAVATRADQRLAADTIRYDGEAGTAAAVGNVVYQDRSVLMNATRADSAIEADTTTLAGLRYQLIGESASGAPMRGMGAAETAVVKTVEGARTTELSAVDFSTCESADPAWRIVARHMVLDHEDGSGRAEGMRLELGGTTVLALPRASFPIDDRRRSGFLIPSIGGSSDDGFDLTVPYYLNLAPNYDATLAPRLVTDRGLMLGGEFRWLGARDRGTVAATFLPDDREADRDRHSINLFHSFDLSSSFNLTSNINRVSDDRYFQDFGDGLSAAATTLLPSSVYLAGRGEAGAAGWWALAAGGDEYQVTDPRIGAAGEPYRRLPRVVVESALPLGGTVELGLRGEFVSFDKDAYGETNARVSPITGERLDLTPWLAVPFERAWGFVRPELALRHTRYELDLGSFANDPVCPASRCEVSPTRTTPIASVDAGLYFDRATNWFGTPLRQTLEPRLYYLRVPDRDQSTLPLFDTQELSFSFAQLFRPNRYTGADRQMDADQLTVALSTRLIDDAAGGERLRASIGQIRYFDDQSVQLPGVPPTDFDGSAWAAELDLALSPRWRVVAAQIHDPETDRSSVSSVRLQHQFGERGVANLAYRYRRGLFEQLDASAAIPLTANTRLVARWNWSLADSRTLEGFAGVEYSACCWALRVLGRHYVRNIEGETANALFVELELKGLGSLGRRSEDFLRRAILGYR
jgi:LPS-assembly protein